MGGSETPEGGRMVPNSAHQNLTTTTTSKHGYWSLSLLNASCRRSLGYSGGGNTWGYHSTQAMILFESGAKESGESVIVIMIMMDWRASERWYYFKFNHGLRELLTGYRKLLTDCVHLRKALEEIVLAQAAFVSIWHALTPVDSGAGVRISEENTGLSGLRSKAAVRNASALLGDRWAHPSPMLLVGSRKLVHPVVYRMEELIQLECTMTLVSDGEQDEAEIPRRCHFCGGRVYWAPAGVLLTLHSPRPGSRLPTSFVGRVPSSNHARYKVHPSVSVSTSSGPSSLLASLNFYALCPRRLPPMCWALGLLEKAPVSHLQAPTHKRLAVVAESSRRRPGPNSHSLVPLTLSYHCMLSNNFCPSTSGHWPRPQPSNSPPLESVVDVSPGDNASITTFDPSDAGVLPLDDTFEDSQFRIMSNASTLDGMAFGGRLRSFGTQSAGSQSFTVVWTSQPLLFKLTFFTKADLLDFPQPPEFTSPEGMSQALGSATEILELLIANHSLLDPRAQSSLEERRQCLCELLTARYGFAPPHKLLDSLVSITHRSSLSSPPQTHPTVAAGAATTASLPSVSQTWPDRTSIDTNDSDRATYHTPPSPPLLDLSEDDCHQPQENNSHQPQEDNSHQPQEDGTPLWAPSNAPVSDSGSLLGHPAHVFNPNPRLKHASTMVLPGSPPRRGRDSAEETFSYNFAAMSLPRASWSTSSLTEEPQPHSRFSADTEDGSMPMSVSMPPAQSVKKGSLNHLLSSSYNVLSGDSKGKRSKGQELYPSWGKMNPRDLEEILVKHAFEDKGGSSGGGHHDRRLHGSKSDLYLRSSSQRPLIFGRTPSPHTATKQPNFDAVVDPTSWYDDPVIAAFLSPSPTLHRPTPTPTPVCKCPLLRGVRVCPCPASFQWRSPDEEDKRKRLFVDLLMEGISKRAGL
ncbi:hypothetical protein FA13DRAFT_1706147 [Coprinellus micaceus]|uniref:Uncharacterized protein n=1 Tax=Coprinellus micaceus TaxID=71717 RepID=A0A4Y7TS09_COPMI|nr:hypothetical protein FA13DRAFT_1706147 [Coprinellus micaceus]